MSEHKLFKLVFAFTAFLAVGITGCSSSSQDDDRGCLSLGCSGYVDPKLNSTSSNTEVVTVASGFTCSVASDYTAVKHGEQFAVTVTAQGTFKPPLEITQGLLYPVENFYQNLKIFGSLNNTTAASVRRTGGVTLKDASGKYASCNYTVVVAPQNSASSLGCDIVVSNNSPAAGSQVNFQFLGRGGNGTYTFTEFRPYAERLLPDTSITKTSNTESRSAFFYTTPVTRFASVIVTNGTAIGSCRAPIFVGGSLPGGYQSGWDWSGLPPWFNYGGGYNGGGFFYPLPVLPVPPTINTCDIVLSPSPGIAGTLSNLKVVIPAYVSGGPFEIAGQSESIPGITSQNRSRGLPSNVDDLPLIPRPSLLERKIRFRDAGFHALTVNYRNAAGTVRGSCSANHQANAAGGFAISPDQSNAFSVNTYTGLTPQFGPTTSLPDANHRGARVAMADVNGDGVADLIVGGGKYLPSGNPIYRVVVRDGRNLSTVLYDFNPLPSHPDGNGGLFVAGGDLDADGKAEIIVGQDADYVAGKASSWIKVYSIATGSPVLKYAVQPFAGNFGVRVAVGDVNGDGFADILAVPGKEGGAILKAYNGRLMATAPWSTIFTPVSALKVTNDLPLHSGAFVAAGDLDGDGRAEILTSLDVKASTDGANYKHEVYIYDGVSGALQSYKPAPFGSSYEGGIRISAGDLDGDGRADILAVPGQAMPFDGYGSSFKVYDYFTYAFRYFVPYSIAHTQGMFVGGGAGGL